MKVKLNLPESERIIRDKGLEHDGHVQMFHTQNVLRRIKKYMPSVSGSLYKLTVAQTDIRRPMIVTRAPQAKYLFFGKVMIDPQINAAGFLTPEGWRSRIGSVKVLTERNLKYSSGGPRWDRALVAAEKDAIIADLQRYIRRR